MLTIKKFNYREYREAVVQAKAEGHKVIERLWDGIQFDHMTIRYIERRA